MIKQEIATTAWNAMWAAEEQMNENPTPANEAIWDVACAAFKAALEALKL